MNHVRNEPSYDASYKQHAEREQKKKPTILWVDRKAHSDYYDALFPRFCRARSFSVNAARFRFVILSGDFIPNLGQIYT